MGEWHVRGMSNENLKRNLKGGKKTSGIAGRRCKDEIKSHLADICFDDVDSCYVAQGRIE
jgi:hypothetical protein